MSFSWINQLGDALKLCEKEACNIQSSRHIRLGSLLASSKVG